MTKEEYAEYEATVKNFFEKEGITNLSTGATKCPTCDVELDCNECPQCGLEVPTEPYISSQQCDCCKDTQQGDRYDAYGYNPTTKEIKQYVVCEDCAYYAEYGRLDDTTMMEME